ncbi:MAG: PKD domain-containing protein, partial [Bacteroidota bacterium]
PTADDVFVPINAIAISIPGTYAPVCAGTPVQLSGAVGGSAVSGTWTTNGQGTFSPPGAPTTSILNPSYIPSNAELQAGASITMPLTTNDPDGAGPCPAASQNTVVTINAAPPAVFILPSVCVNVPVTLNGPPSPITNPISSWKWNFGDGTSDTGQSVIKTYSTSNQFNIQLTITGVNGCVTTSDPKTVVVGLNPVPIFDLYKVCEGDFTEFESATTNIPVEQYKWEFGDGDVLGQDFVQGLPDQSNLAIPNGTNGNRSSGTYKSPNHKYSSLVSGSSDDYSVKLTVYTNLGCQGSIQKTARILKVLSPTPASFYDMEMLNGGDGFWSIEPNSINSSWGFGDLNKNIIKANSKGWVTNPSLSLNSGYYNNNEQSSVNSPCFDLTNFTKPVISLNYWLDTQLNTDGAVLQSTLNGGRNWQSVGGFLGNNSTGVNWYNK